ncbi:GGDEF domain-containing protein [Lentzea flaviverrucosa]|uniref:Diguanylate cyclase (GGDEF) domain-containing protein n=1 Tax=Lentzea flaviverrucosa TaxID=200379 RepID=A0A1H9AHF1_9PSEU|nr:GGDEF domain-containing protein [Lentzea flaviverrucosa]RDI32067.1 diguanylate cyclase (GGDEF)-like protein [Lentzea flaviverrucosa]SEP75907.1 diguanylate cyclase (GGDEF) domain-containing protein [Lentzea flaviverrucosa]
MVLAYVVTVVVLASLVTLATAWRTPAEALTWTPFLLLAGGAVLHLEAAQGIERIREISREGSPHAHMQSVWLFAGVLVLPTPLLVALICISYLHAWLRVYKRRAVLFRKVFSAATVVLACAAAQLILRFFSNRPLDVDGPLGLLALTGAGLVYWLVNYALVVGAIVMTNRDQPARAALGNASDQLIILASIGLGSVLAIMMTSRPWLTPLLLLTVLALHMGLLLPQFRVAARTDSKTGLVDATFWHDVAGREIERARRLLSTVGVLILDLDHFKQINDTYGHLAGDRVLRAVADALKHSVRSYDLVGRFGGEEFAVLLPGVSTEEVRATAERIRFEIASLHIVALDRLGESQVVAGLTASVGAAVFPDSATDLSPLLLAADEALYQAKNNGRDRVATAAATR